MKGLVRLLRGYQSGDMPGIVIAWELIPWGGRWGATLQLFCLVWSLAFLSSCLY